MVCRFLLRSTLYLSLNPYKTMVGQETALWLCLFLPVTQSLLILHHTGQCMVHYMAYLYIQIVLLLLGSFSTNHRSFRSLEAAHPLHCNDQLKLAMYLKVSEASACLADIKATPNSHISICITVVAACTNCLLYVPVSDQ